MEYTLYSKLFYMRYIKCLYCKHPLTVQENLLFSADRNEAWRHEYSRHAGYWCSEMEAECEMCTRARPSSDRRTPPASVSTRRAFKNADVSVCRWECSSPVCVNEINNVGCSDFKIKGQNRNLFKRKCNHSLLHFTANISFSTNSKISIK